MEELLRSLGIEPTEDAETIVSKLERKQSEFMERLDNVEDERRRQKLENDLNRIAGAISAFSWMRGKARTGIARDEDAVSDDFSDLKNQPRETKTDPPKPDQSGPDSSKSDQPGPAPEVKKNKTQKDLYDEALAAMATPDYAKGMEMMRTLAENHYSWAQLQMGRMYDEGNRVQKDETIAAEWYERAAKHGNEEAQYRLGDKYYFGNGLLQNYEKAAEWFHKAAKQGHAQAQYSLGFMCENDQGVRGHDYEGSRWWYQKAAVQGHVHAQNCLGKSYERSKEYKEALKWYYKAIDQGSVEAKCNLGHMYEMGWGVRQDYEKAEEWYYKAAYMGNADAQYYLGCMYDVNGHAAARDAAKAEEWYRKAAEQGHPGAQKRLIELERQKKEWLYKLL